MQDRGKRSEEAIGMQVVTIAVNRRDSAEVPDAVPEYEYVFITPFGESDPVDVFYSVAEARDAASLHWRQFVLETAAVMPAFADILRGWEITPETAE
jgi:hypothetical protein